MNAGDVQCMLVGLCLFDRYIQQNPQKIDYSGRGPQTVGRNWRKTCFFQRNSQDLYTRTHRISVQGASRDSQDLYPRIQQNSQHLYIGSLYSIPLMSKLESNSQGIHKVSEDPIRISQDLCATDPLWAQDLKIRTGTTFAHGNSYPVWDHLICSLGIAFVGSASLLVELGRDCGNALLPVTVGHQTGDPIRFTRGNIRKQIKVKVVLPSQKMFSLISHVCHG